LQESEPKLWCFVDHSCNYGSHARVAVFSTWWWWWWWGWGAPVMSTALLEHQKHNPASIVSGYGLDGRGVGVRLQNVLYSCSKLLWGPPSFLHNGYRAARCLSVLPTQTVSNGVSRLGTPTPQNNYRDEASWNRRLPSPCCYSTSLIKVRISQKYFLRMESPLMKRQRTSLFDFWMPYFNDSNKRMLC
jgi:hypothetical protein